MCTCRGVEMGGQWTGSEWDQKNKLETGSEQSVQGRCPGSVSHLSGLSDEVLSEAHGQKHTHTHTQAHASTNYLSNVGACAAGPRMI